MTVCPSCKSSRIRNDYKLAPIWLRMVGIRALLCDQCNRQFKAFAPRAPKGGRPRRARRLPDSVPEIDLGSLRQDVAEARSVKAETLNRMELSLKPGQAGDVAGEEVTVQALPVRHDIQTQVLRLHSRQPAAKVAEAPPSIAPALPECSACGSENVRRRRRTTLERATLTLANLKAFNCRDCGASFYAKFEEADAKSDPGLFGSSAFGAEPKG